jgi:hypothetical protein
VKFGHVLLANAVFFFFLAAICFSHNYSVYYSCNGGSRRVYPLTRYGEVFLFIAVPLLIIGLLGVIKEWKRRRCMTEFD